MALTFLGGIGFMAVKTVEYQAKWQHHVFVGPENQYHTAYPGDRTEKFRDPDDHGATGAGASSHGAPGAGTMGAGTMGAGAMDAGAMGAGSMSTGASGAGASGAGSSGAGASGGDTQTANAQAAHAGEATRQETADTHAHAATDHSTREVVPVISRPDSYIDPNAGTPDAAKMLANFHQVAGLAETERHTTHVPQFKDMRKLDQERVSSFFSIYFIMTGLHGLHVLVGMGLIAWVTIKTYAGQFGPVYYTPVEIVGLYWHLVDLIWIFLFPLLYLIH